MCTLLYSSKWHQDVPGQAHSEDFGEGMSSKLVHKRAKNTGSVTVEEVENHYLLPQVGPGGKRVGVQNAPKNLATTTNKIFRSRPDLHGLRGMGAQLRQHRCNFVAEEVTEISTRTNTTPWLQPLPAT